MRILIAGVGNIFSRDDGCGSFLAEALQGCIKGADVIDFGTAGISVVDKIAEYDLVIILDAGNIQEDVRVIEVNEQTLDSDEIAQTVLVMTLGGSHSLGVEDILTLLKSQGFSGRIVLLLCKPYSLDIGIGLTEGCKVNALKAIDVLKELLSKYDVDIDVNKAKENLINILSKYK